MSASVSFMITKAQEQRLLALGYSQTQINAMKPSEAHTILIEFDADKLDADSPPVTQVEQHKMTLELDEETLNALNQGFTADELEAEQQQEVDNKRRATIDAIKTIVGTVGVIGVSSVVAALNGLSSVLKSTAFETAETDEIANILYQSGLEHESVEKIMQVCKLTPPAPTFTPFTFEELEAMPPKEWIIDQVLGKGDLGMVYGPPGCGKTFVVTDMIISAIMGKQWAMRFDIPRPLNVAYCAGEGISGLPARFMAAATHHEATRDDKRNFTFFRNVPQFFSGDDVSEAIAITRFVTEWQKRRADGTAQPLDILFVDTLNTATVAADENSAKDMGKVLAMCRWATQELGCAVVLVHHTNKTGTAERGSSALRGAMDVMIEIKRISENGTKAIMACEKLKDGEAWKPQTLDLVPVADVDSVRIWWDEPSETTGNKGKEEAYKKVMLDFMQSQPGKKFTAKILAEVAGIGQNNAIRILSRAKNDGLCSSELMDTSKPNSNRNPLAYFANLP